MLSARDLSLRRGPLPLFEGVNFTVYRGNKVGLTGANGSGKSSLFAALRGELGPDRGDIDWPSGLRIAHVEQEIGPIDRTALDFVMDGDQELRSVMAAIETAEKHDEAMRLAELHASLEALDGYRAPARAAALLHGLGFKPEDHQRKIFEFSGGWRVRAGLARALNSRADLLLLDEPTNHLDLDAIVWLEEWLTAYQGTLIMISHDREFLDRIIDRVLHIENRAIRAYTGNYSDFEQKRTLELAQQQALQARQMRRIEEITSFVTRFRAKASKSRQAQSRLKMLQKMERIVPAHVDSPFEFHFAAPAKTPRPLLTVEDAECGYDGRIILRDLNLSIGPQDRIALLGPNGAGKSTLTKMLAGEAPPIKGRRIPAADLAVGYFAQQQMEQLKLDCTAFWHVRNLGGADYAAGDEQRVRDHLGQFGFTGERAFEPVERFSGGEKARLTLALLVARRPNFLLLDEPTNHLDIDMRQALSVALQGFEGGLVIVSHDRHLIKTVADTLWLVADGKLEDFDGDLDDYQQWLKSRSRVQQEPKKAPTVPAPVPPRKVRDANLSRRRREMQELERQIGELTDARAALEAALGDAAIDHGEVSAKWAELDRDLNLLEARWLDLGTAIEAAEAAAR